MSNLEARLTGALADHVKDVQGDPDALMKIEKRIAEGRIQAHLDARSN